jgi:hypothetical protein
VDKSFFASLLPSGHFLHHCCLSKCRTTRVSLDQSKGQDSSD